MAPQYSELVELLIEGSRYDDAEDVQSALDQGVDINAQDEQGRTAVHMAAANGHVDLLRMLLQSGASVLLTNVEGNTPLHWACLNNQKEAVRLLLQHGANPSSINSHDMTPVDEALTRNYQDIVDVINECTKPGVSAQEQKESIEMEGEEIDDAEMVGGEESTNE